ncbi:MAG: prepilin peptidase [Deltaproteobacteria bacterium]|nr:prepilin peptidase [Deltaproteobacteria bacterium]
MPTPAFLTLAALVGLAVGSFLNVVITRLPRDEPFWSGRSRCPHCGVTLRWRDNVPLLSFVWLKGRCRVCGESISWRYPLVELAGAALGAALWARFPGDPLLLAYAPFAAALVVLTVLDLEYYWLPDVITLPGIALGLTLSLVLPGMDGWESFLGALLGAAFFQAIRWLYQKITALREGTERVGMGGGDVKLLAFIGAFLGVWALPWVVFVSAAAGSLAGLAAAWRRGQGRLTPIPYGPFLAGAALFELFWS